MDTSLLALSFAYKVRVDYRPSKNCSFQLTQAVFTFGMGRTGKVWCEFGHFGVKSVIGPHCLMRPQLFRFAKTLKIGQNIKDAVVLGWGRQISENLGLTIAITAVTVIGYQ